MCSAIVFVLILKYSGEAGQLSIVVTLYLTFLVSEQDSCLAVRLDPTKEVRSVHHVGDSYQHGYHDDGTQQSNGELYRCAQYPFNK